MTVASCERCGLGSMEGIDSSLRKVVLHKDGFRDRVAYVHRKQVICTLAANQRGKAAAAEAARQREHNRWWRRAARRVGLG